MKVIYHPVPGKKKKKSDLSEPERKRKNRPFKKEEEMPAWNVNRATAAGCFAELLYKMVFKAKTGS